MGFPFESTETHFLPLWFTKRVSLETWLEPQCLTLQSNHSKKISLLASKNAVLFFSTSTKVSAPCSITKLDILLGTAAKILSFTIKDFKSSKPLTLKQFSNTSLILLQNLKMSHWTLGSSFWTSLFALLLSI